MVSKVIKLLVFSLVIIGLALIASYELNNYWNNKLTNQAVDFKVPSNLINPVKTVSTKSSAPINPCAANTLNQLILVSISQRHLWACNSTSVAYSSPVVTGISYLAADLTPVGTYHIYAKETNVYLTGHDSTGSWDDFVNYWMPFLYNQYGAYGLHDATWRPANAFGHISPNSSNGSHGCVECPLATARFLFNWSQIGTTVTIKS